MFKISLKVETSSSMADEVLSILDFVWNDKEQLFRGSAPTALDIS